MLSPLPQDGLFFPSIRESQETIGLQQEYIQQLEQETQELTKAQEEANKKITELMQQLKQKNPCSQKLKEEELLKENKSLKEDFKICLTTMQELKKQTNDVLNVQKNIQKENEELKLKLEKIDLEEAKTKIINRLDRPLYFLAALVSLLVFALFGSLSAICLVEGTLVVCYQWSKQGFRKNLDNRLRIYSKNHLQFSQKTCLHHLYPYTQTI